MTTLRVYTVAFVPEELHQDYLQHLRDFDTAHPNCHFEIMVDAPDLSLEEMIERLRVNPALTFQKIIERKRENDGST